MAQARWECCQCSTVGCLPRRGMWCRMCWADRQRFTTAEAHLQCSCWHFLRGNITHCQARTGWLQLRGHRPWRDQLQRASSGSCQSYLGRPAGAQWRRQSLARGQGGCPAVWQQVALGLRSGWRCLAFTSKGARRMVIPIRRSPAGQGGLVAGNAAIASQGLLAGPCEEAPRYTARQ